MDNEEAYDPLEQMTQSLNLLLLFGHLIALIPGWMFRFPWGKPQ